MWLPTCPASSSTALTRSNLISVLLRKAENTRMWRKSVIMVGSEPGYCSCTAQAQVSPRSLAEHCCYSMQLDGGALVPSSTRHASGTHALELADQQSLKARLYVDHVLTRK